MPQGEPNRSYVAPVIRKAEVERFCEFLPPPKDGTSPPILSITGSGGIGKTTFLRQLMKELNQLTPRAYVDCADFPEEDLPRFLQLAKFFLSLRCRPVGSLWFRRLEIGFIALDADVDFRSSHRGALRELSDAVDRRKHTVPDAFDQIAGAGTSDLLGHALSLPLGGIALPNTTAEMSKVMAERFAGWRNHSGRVKDALAWFGHRDRRAGDDPVSVLAELNRWQSSPNGPQDRDELLIDAFLADIRDAFRFGGLKTREPYNCVLFMDNADRGLGPDFLDRIRELREVNRQIPHLSAEQLLIVTAGRDEVSGISATGLELPYFTVQQVSALGSPVAVGTDKRFAKLVHHFTDGYPAVTSALINFYCRNPIPVADGLDDLLAVRTDRGTGASVEERLFTALEETFLQDTDNARLPESAMGILSTCVAARRLDDAVHLVEAFHRNGMVNRSILSETGMWDDEPIEAGLSLLRWLFLRRLLERGTEALDWDTVFEELRRRRQSDNDGRAVADELYYALAMNKVDEVVEDLAGRLRDTRMECSWLDLVRDVATAPCTRDVSKPYDAQIGVTNPLANDEKPHLISVANVVVGLWIANQPCTGPDRKDLHTQVKEDLRRLAAQADRPSQLRAEARQQERLERYWKLSGEPAR
ncbi:MAG: hypothetical protein ACRD0P_11615 [Stackebrandtia sp.]